MTRSRGHYLKKDHDCSGFGVFQYEFLKLLREFVQLVQSISVDQPHHPLQTKGRRRDAVQSPT